jgi:hypothetical protein
MPSEGQRPTVSVDAVNANGSFDRHDQPRRLPASTDPQSPANGFSSDRAICASSPVSPWPRPPAGAIWYLCLTRRLTLLVVRRVRCRHAHAGAPSLVMSRYPRPSIAVAFGPDRADGLDEPFLKENSDGCLILARLGKRAQPHLITDSGTLRASVAERDACSRLK